MDEQIADRDKKQPYVRYKVTADVEEKGIGFSIEKALKNYLKAAGHESTISVAVRNSNRFEAVVNLFDNGNYDFNMEAFVRAVEESGRMPSNVHHKPSINIKPIELGEIVTDVQEREVTDDIAWQKTIDGLHETISEMKEEHEKQSSNYDGTIENLTKSLGALQNTVKEKTGQVRDRDERISRLQKIIDEGVPVMYNSPLSALINSYANQFQEQMLDLSADLEVLVREDTLDVFLECESCGISFVDYLRIKHGFEFESDEEISRLQEQVSAYDSFEQIPEVEELQKRKNDLERDEAKIKSLEGELSEDILGVMNSALDDKKKSIKTYESELFERRDEFNQKKEQLKVVADELFSESYSNLVDVLNSSKERINSGDYLPIIVDANLSRENPSVEVYFPFIDEEGVFEKHLIDYVGGYAKDKGLNFDYAPSETYENMYSCRFTLPNDRDLSNLSEGELSEFTTNLCKSVKELSSDSISNRLGVNLSPIVLRR